MNWVDTRTTPRDKSQKVKYLGRKKSTMTRRSCFDRHIVTTVQYIVATTTGAATSETFFNNNSC